jgi:sulfatase modifying factor 1
MLAVGCGGRTNDRERSDAATASPAETSIDASDDKDAATPPSCAPGGPGMTNCGLGGSGTGSCCTSLEVMGGTYYRAYDVDDGGLPLLAPDGGSFPALAPDGGPTAEADPATLSSFRLDKYLVTVGRFRQFVSAWNGGAGWLPPAGSGKHVHLNGGAGLVSAGQPGTYEPGWLASDDASVAPTSSNLACGLDDRGSPSGTWTLSPGPNEDLPINCVNWWEAYAFCIWDGGFLPSGAEWEYAAAGGNQQRAYPWGSKDPGTGNEFAIYGCYYPSGSLDASLSLTFTCSSVANIAPVGTAILGAGLWGQLDLAGDVWVWNLDQLAAYVPCVDCADFTSSDGRLLRGGSFRDPKLLLLSASRENVTGSDYRSSDLGFRCARTP